MVSRILEQKQALAIYTADCGSLPSLDGNDWRTLEKITRILKIFHETTIKMSYRESTISDIIPQVEFLKRFLVKALDDDFFIGVKPTIKLMIDSM